MTDFAIYGIAQFVGIILRHLNVAPTALCRWKTQYTPKRDPKIVFRNVFGLAVAFLLPVNTNFIRDHLKI